MIVAASQQLPERLVQTLRRRYQAGRPAACLAERPSRLRREQRRDARAPARSRSVFRTTRPDRATTNRKRLEQLDDPRWRERGQPRQVPQRRAGGSRPVRLRRQSWLPAACRAGLRGAAGADGHCVAGACVRLREPYRRRPFVAARHDGVSTCSRAGIATASSQCSCAKSGLAGLEARSRSSRRRRTSTSPVPSSARSRMPFLSGGAPSTARMEIGQPVRRLPASRPRPAPCLVAASAISTSRRLSATRWPGRAVGDSRSMDLDRSHTDRPAVRQQLQHVTGGDRRTAQRTGHDGAMTRRC